MFQVHKIQWKPLIVSVVISMGTGILSGFLIRGNVDVYQTLEQPKLAPPAYIFPVIWSILYFLMGVSAYFVYASDAPQKKQALLLYGAQLAVNFFWPILFFHFNAYFLSFFWLLLLWFLTIAMILSFREINPTSALLQLPYLFWITFAGYLNLSVALLNR